MLRRLFRPLKSWRPPQVGYPEPPGDPGVQRELWTRDVTTLMAGVILAAAVLIGAGILAGVFELASTLPIYILLAVILPTWWAARRGLWRWSRFIPVLLCFGLGVFGTYAIGFRSTFVLFFALAVLLAGMLLGKLPRRLTTAASIIVYLGLGFSAEGWSFENLPAAILFTFGISSIGMLQNYTNHRLGQALEKQLVVNEQLQAEIRRRIEVERSLQEHETQFRRLAENMSDLVAEMGLDGAFHYVSPSYQANLGYTPAELLRMNAFTLIHPDDISTALEATQRAIHGRGSERLELRTRHADGYYLHFELVGRAIFTPEGLPAGIIFSSRDITQQKQAETAAVTSERKFRSVIEALPLGVILYALEDHERLVIRDHNPAVETILGLAGEDLAGRSLEEAFPGLAGSDVADQFRAIARGGETLKLDHFSYQDERMRGFFRVNAFKTNPGNLAVVFEDETESLRSAEALRLSEEKFSAAFLTSPDAININRLSDGLYLDVNQGFTRLVGYTREEAIGKTSLELNIWADPADRLRLVKGLREKGEVQNLEARFRLKNGDVRIGLMSARIIPINGEPCILSITRDVTDWIQAEEQLREAHYQLEHAYEATLEGWAQALELRERETATHSRRVVGMTLEVARMFGFEGLTLAQIRRGALLHDIGKLGVPDKILLKPEPLDTEEWAIMRQHPEYGRQLLSRIEYLRPSITIPHCHHEKWDGTGYPQGLRGEQIPLAARIFAVADVYEALTSDRPYRPRWSRADTRRYIQDQSGKHFDPQIVAIFLSIIENSPHLDLHFDHPSDPS